MVSSAHEGPLSSHPPAIAMRWTPAIRRGPTPSSRRASPIFPTRSRPSGGAYGSIRENSIQHGFRAQLNAPMLKDGQAIGCICLRRRNPGAFTPRQITLLETFAAQAVIAIENVRLFTRAQREALEQQTATAEILRVHLAVADRRRSRCSTPSPRRHCASAAPRMPRSSCATATSWLIAGPRGPDRRTDVGTRCRSTRRLRPGGDPRRARRSTCRTCRHWTRRNTPTERESRGAMDSAPLLAAPMLREGAAIGAISLRRREPGAFTAAPDRAARELRRPGGDRHRERAAVHRAARNRSIQQTATSDVLSVISRSTSELQPVLEVDAGGGDPSVQRAHGRRRRAPRRCPALSDVDRRVGRIRQMAARDAASDGPYLDRRPRRHRQTSHLHSQRSGRSRLCHADHHDGRQHRQSCSPSRCCARTRWSAS